MTGDCKWSLQQGAQGYNEHQWAMKGYRLSRALWAGGRGRMWIRRMRQTLTSWIVKVSKNWTSSCGKLRCPAREGPQDCWQNNHCQENGHGRETDEKVIVPQQITKRQTLCNLCNINLISISAYFILLQEWIRTPSSTWRSDKLETQA